MTGDISSNIDNDAYEVHVLMGCQLSVVRSGAVKNPNSSVKRNNNTRQTNITGQSLMCF
jgi:hypothetical protein